MPKNQAPAVLHKWKKFVVAFDPHGDKQHVPSVNSFFKFVDLYKPDLRVHGGDGFDFRPLRRKASAEEKREIMRDDFEGGIRFIERLRPDVYLRGNHCERLYDLAAGTEGPLCEYGRSLCGEFEKALGPKCKHLPYDKRRGVYKLGNLSVIHGFGSGGPTSLKNTAIAFGPVIMGHIHAKQLVTIASMESKFCQSVGCLCELDLDYNRASVGTLAQSNGWSYGVFNERTGAYNLWVAEKVGGHWMLPTGIESF